MLFKECEISWPLTSFDQFKGRAIGFENSYALKWAELKGHTIGLEGSPKVESAAMKGAKQILLSAHPGDRWPVIAELFQLRTRDDLFFIDQNPAHNDWKEVWPGMKLTWERLVPFW